MSTGPSRIERIPNALAWYTDTLGLTITTINYPTRIEEGVGGTCSCGKDYRYTAEGTIDKSEPGTLCESPGKHPNRPGFISNPDVQATTAEQALRLWAKLPWNIGIVTGKRTGLVVLDVDVRSDGLSSMTQLTAAFDSMGAAWQPNETFSYTTSGDDGARGYHLYFRADPDDNDLWKSMVLMGENILPGVEMKWKSGIVVAAPSLHASGAVYELAENIRPILTLDRAKINDLGRALAIAKGATVEGTASFAAPSTLAARAKLVRASAGTSGGQLTFFDAGTPADANRAVEGWASRLVERLIYDGEPACHFGPGDHHEPFKKMIAASIRLFPPPPSMGIHLLKRLTDEPEWLPWFYVNLFRSIDQAYIKPEPWESKEPLNYHNICRTTLLNELSTYRYALNTSN